MIKKTHPPKHSFNPRSRRGSDLKEAFLFRFWMAVSIHAPAGGATKPFLRMMQMQQVSIHAPAGGATKPPPEPDSEEIVSIHAPAGGATNPSLKRSTATLVSIHAPAGGATLQAQDVLGGCHVSIHAPAGGATLTLLSQINLFWFQSTLPQGERQDPGHITLLGFPVSIHAPAGGATPASDARTARISSFNPRSRRGSDKVKKAKRPMKDSFNPRSRRGSDGRFRSTLCSAGVFQSTLPQGERRPGPGHQQLFTGVSIHAPAGGATADGCPGGWPPRWFQSTLPQGERRIIPNGLIFLTLFQSTLPQGERLLMRISVQVS